MNLYITQQGSLRFIEGRPYMELIGWTVRAAYDCETSSMLSGATLRGLSKEAVIAKAHKAMRLHAYNNLLNA